MIENDISGINDKIVHRKRSECHKQRTEENADNSTLTGFVLLIDKACRDAENRA